MPKSISLDPSFPDITESDSLYARSSGLIPADTQTLAKGPGQYVKGVAPKYLARGLGSHVWDVDGNEYIDFTMGVGPISLGYARAEVDDAIRSQLKSGITFSQMHPLEVEVSELIREVVPGAEMVRFSKTGCDVTTAAVRLARAFTQRDRVVCCGYHGWHDWYVATLPPDAGVPKATAELTSTFQYNDLDSLAEAIDDETACVILEPTVFEAPKPGFLQGLVELAHARGALVIFDEMWTGFRLAVGGAQERFGVTADLACFSKAIANGMPISALTGRSDVMQLLSDDVFFFTTFGGEALSLAAAKETIKQMRKHDVPAYLEATGSQLKDAYNVLAEELGLSFTRCVGFGARTLVTFAATDEAEGQDPLVMKSLVQQELVRRGVLWTGFHNMCFAHTQKDLDHLLAAYREALGVLRDGIRSKDLMTRLNGEPVRAVFRKTSGFHTKPRVVAPAHGSPSSGSQASKPTGDR